MFGGQYRASLINSGPDFVRVLKYVYQNPVKAKICKRVESYPFSTIDDLDEIPRENSRLKTCFLETEIFADAKLLHEQGKMYEYLNSEEKEFELLSMQRALRRNIFKIPVGKHLQL